MSVKPQNQKEHFAGSSVQFEKPLTALVVPHCVVPCACRGSTAESINKRKPCSSATCFLPKLDLAVVFSCDRLNQNRSGIQQLSLDCL